MFTPWALSICSGEPNTPTAPTRSPWTTNSPPMIRRTSNRRAFEAGIGSSVMWSVLSPERDVEREGEDHRDGAEQHRVAVPDTVTDEGVAAEVAAADAVHQAVQFLDRLGRGHHRHGYPHDPDGDEPDAGGPEPLVHVRAEAQHHCDAAQVGG